MVEPTVCQFACYRLDDMPFCAGCKRLRYPLPPALRSRRQVTDDRRKVAELSQQQQQTNIL